MKIVSGLRVKLFFFKLNLKLVLFLIQKYGIGKQFKDKKAQIERFKEQFTIDKSFYKYLRHNNRVYLNCNIPGIPFTDFFERISNLAADGLIHKAFDEVFSSLNLSSDSGKHFPEVTSRS